MSQKKIKPTAKSVQVAADVVENGGLIVFPWGRLENRCLALMCDSKNLEACRRMNKIKTRSATQVLALNGYPDLIPEIAEIQKSQPLMSISKRLKIPPVEVLEQIMKTGAVSFIFEAKKGLPKIVTTKSGNKTTVMVAGEVDHHSDYDFYTELVKELHKRGIITAGSSANRTLNGTYHLFEQEKAYQDLKDDVDIFIYHSPLPRKPLTAFNLESCTCFNMTVERPYPEVYRFGSVHPDKFKKILGKYIISDKVKYLPKREKKLHMILKDLINLGQK